MHLPNNAPVKVWYISDTPDEKVNRFFWNSFQLFQLTYIKSKEGLDYALKSYSDTKGTRNSTKPDIILLGNIWEVEGGDGTPLAVANIISDREMKDTIIVPFVTSGRVAESNRKLFEWSRDTRIRLSELGLTVCGLGDAEKTRLNPLELFYTGGGAREALESLIQAKQHYFEAPVFVSRRPEQV